MTTETVNIAPSWKVLLSDEFEKPYFKELRERVRAAYMEGKVYPHPTRMFRAFEEVSPEGVKVVILGQDPYHTPGVADGLAFSSVAGNPIPPSLLNMYKEIEEEFGVGCERTPDLTRWAKQGVLLLNASLTVGAGDANSHADFGWHTFTDAVITVINRHCEHVVFMLWGSFARKKAGLIDQKRHLVLESAHPSPLSAHKGFFGNGHFKKANAFLKEKGREEIVWQ
jgi:uracil-DNA glycosylase